MSPSVSTGSGEKPATEGKISTAISLDEGEAKRVNPPGVSCSAFLIKSDPTNSNLWFGFDDDVTTNNGYFYEPGETLDFTLDLAEQDIYVYTDGSNDAVYLTAIE